MTIVAVAQTSIDLGDPAGTIQRALAAVRDAAAAGAQLVVLPELCTTGGVYASSDEAAATAEPADGPGVSRITALSADLGLVIVFGFAETNPDGKPYNSALVVDHGQTLAVYRKTHLWDREKLIFEPGDQPPPVLDTSVGRVAALICYDLEFPEVVRDVALRGAQLIAAPANWPVVPKPAAERPIEVAKAQVGAAVNKVFVAVADRCGVERGVDWFGSSVICDLHGFPVAGPASGRPVLLVADLDLAAADDKALGPYNDAFADRRVDLDLISPGK